MMLLKKLVMIRQRSKGGRGVDTITGAFANTKISVVLHIPPKFAQSMSRQELVVIKNVTKDIQNSANG